MAHTIDKVNSRAKLKPRREPYWYLVARGQYLGYRKMTGDTPGHWIARALDVSTRKRVFHPLGDFSALPDHQRFDTASKAAREWFEHLGQGGSTGPATVRIACQRYVAHIEHDKRDTARTRQKKGAPKGETETYVPGAKDAEDRFRNYVLSLPWLADLELSGLLPQHLEKWRKHLAQLPTKSGANRGKHRTQSTLNRDMTCFRAALNLAFEDGLVLSDRAWRTKLVPVKNADGRRELYLDRAQRGKLVEHAEADIGQFLKGLSRLPLRPGALAATRVKDFDHRLSTLRIGTDKSGKDRKIKVPPATAEFLAGLCKDKLPAAYIFTRADGKPWNKDAWKGPVKDAVTAAKLPDGATAYALRHSTITDLVNAGTPLLTVAQVSGTSVRMIEKHYGHLLQERGETALAALVA